MTPLGTIQCFGYPEGTSCIVSIPAHSGRVLCHFCTRTRELMKRNREKAEKTGWKDPDG